MNSITKSNNVVYQSITFVCVCFKDYRGTKSQNKLDAFRSKKIKLVYFDLPGRAEYLRMLLTVAKVPFDDVRIKFDQWAELKPSE